MDCSRSYRFTLSLLTGILFPSLQVSAQCNVRSLPAVSFQPNSRHLDRPAKRLLDSVAAILDANPGCTLQAIGHYLGCDPRAGALDWDHTGKVIRYLVDRKGIDPKRVRFSYGSDGSVDSIGLRIGPPDPSSTQVSAPHPNFRKAANSHEQGKSQ